MKNIDKRHFIAVGITVLFLCCGYIFGTAGLRFIESCKDFGLSVAYYFAEMYCLLTGKVNPVKPSVIEVSGIVNIQTAFPLLWEDFTAKMSVFWQRLFTTENFIGYFAAINRYAFVIVIVLLLIVPAAVLLFIVAKRILLSSGKNGTVDSKPLKVFRKLEKKLQPVCNFVKNFILFVKQNKAYRSIWIFIWLVYLNILTIAVEFIAFLIYFVASFDVLHIYLQVYKLSMDAALMFGSLPFIVWLVIFYMVLDKWRRKIGGSRLRRYENRNKGFINSLNLVLMITGSMGSKKTTTLTDIILSQEAMFRDKAFELLQNNDFKFPLFPWSAFESELNNAIAFNQVFNLTSCKDWIRKKQKRFEKAPAKEKLYGYDYMLYPMYRNSELKREYLFDVLETYAQLYFIYTVQSSLIVSNYSVRTDNRFVSEGHFPKWDTDFFKNSDIERNEYTHSHILDFDSLRLGKRLGNNIGGIFEFGVVGITEIGKERGNQIELQGLEKLSDETNQKNDLFNYSLKMARHKATVDNYPFIRFYTDEQRASSWGADGKELCTLLNIPEVAEETLAMPFYFIEELLHDFVFHRFIKLYYDFRFKRSDDTLTLSLLKRLTSFVHRRYTAVHDRYGYYRATIETRAGTLDGEINKHRYYLSKKKIYADRFATDCYSEILTAEKATTGINNIPVYQSTKPSVDEFRRQNSYFIRELFRIGKLEDNTIEVSDKFMALLMQIKSDTDYTKIVSEAYKAYKKDAAKRAIADIENGNLKDGTSKAERRLSGKPKNQLK